MKKHLLILFAAFATLAASAQTQVEIDGIWYYLIPKAKIAKVISGGDYDAITIPATVETDEGEVYNVTSIEGGAFNRRESLTTINIPASVTNIGQYSFTDCISLTTINIPENSQLASIEEGAFAYCYRLTSINIPASVTSIAYNAFHNCSNLTTIAVAEGNTVYDSRDECNAIIETGSNTLIKGCNYTTIPTSVTNIGQYAFYGCSSLNAFIIPENVTSIGEGAFHNCGGELIVNCNIPSALDFSYGTFYNSKITKVTIGKGVKHIGQYAFYGCSNLTTINISESVKSIAYNAFYRCSSLTTITIPENSQLTSIGSGAFYGCSSLTAIVLPKSLEHIYSEAFADCEKLLDVYCYAETVPQAHSDAFNDSYPESITLHVPATALNDYKSTAPWSSFGNIVELGAAITRITLDKTSAILTEGEELTINITTTPSNADRNLISWGSSNPSVATVDNTGKVTAVTPGIATITAIANDGSGVSASCVVEVKKLILGKCATPVISYINGEIVLTCSTEGAEIKTNVTTENDNEFTGTRFEFIPTHTFTAYATKEQYEDSDAATLTLCWIPYGETTGTLNIPSKPVLISTQGGTITLSGLAAGTAVAAYSTAGTPLATATATDGTATLTTNLEAGSIAIVKIGDYSIKVAIK